MNISKSRIAAVAAIALASVLGFSNVVASAATFPINYVTAADITPDRATGSNVAWYGEKTNLGVYAVNAASFDSSEALEIKNTNANDQVRILRSYGPSAAQPTIAQILSNASYTYSGSNVAFTIEMFYTPVDGAAYGPTGTSPCTAANQSLYPGQCYTVIKWEPLALSTGVWTTVDLTTDAPLTSTTGGWKNTNRVGIYAKPGPLLGNSMTEYLAQMSSYTILGVGPALGSGTANQTGYVKSVDINSQNYEFRIVAPTVSTAPTNVSASASSTVENGIDVTWTAPSSDGGSPLLGYFTRVHSSDGSVIASVATPLDTSFTINPIEYNPVLGDSYYVTMVASNSVGFSPESNASQSVLIADVPAAPTSVTATLSGTNEIATTWVTPASNGSALTGYTTHVYTSDDIEVASFPTPLGNSYLITSADFETVLGETYYVKMTASNFLGESVESSASANVVMPNKASPPQNVIATVSGSNVGVSWVAPLNNGGVPLTGYKVIILKGDLSEELYVKVINSPSATSTNILKSDFDGVNDTNYVVVVVADNGVAQSLASTVTPASNFQFESVTPPVTAPGTPTDVTALVTGNNVAVTWVAPTSNGGSPITGYTVKVYTNAGVFVASKVVGNVLNTSISNSAFVPAVVVGSPYYATVEASNADATSTPSTQTVGSTLSFQTVPPVTTAPGVPTAVVAVVSDKTTVKVDWVTPASNGGSAITGYDVKIYNSSNVVVATVPVGVVNTTTILGTTYTAVEGDTYYALVSARNAIGSSDLTAKTTASTFTTFTSPAIPNGDTLVDGNKGGVTVTVVANKDLTATVPASIAAPGVTVYGFAYSTPIALGPAVVQANGTVVWLNAASLLPAGQHRLAVTNASGTVLGWGTMTIAAAGAGDNNLAATGSNDTTTAWTVGGIGGAALIGALAIFFVYRRRTANQK